MRTAPPVFSDASLPIGLGLAAAIGFLAVGCSTTGSSSAAAPSSLTTSPASSSPASLSAAPTLSGTQLARVLLPASSMPAGFIVDKANTLDSASQAPSDSPSAVPASQLCQDFTKTDFIQVAGIGDNDFAQSDYLNADQTQEVAEELDVFTGTDAQQVMTALWQAFGKCATFSYSSNGTTVTSILTRSRLAGQGNDAIKATIVGSIFKGGETIVAIRQGSTVITTLDSDTSDMGSPAVGYAEQIEQRLRAAS